ncbi:MAG: hypothetical protein ACSHX7_02645 [Luteolibacter sp.]
MPLGNQEKFGILPSLEILPFFDEDFLESVGVEFVARASYGSIAREMLVGGLIGGVLPWEIFAAEVLALPGQRDQWKVAFFSVPSPPELVLQTSIYKSLCPDSVTTSRKLPQRLQIGIENRSSLTRHQFSEWLNSLKLSPRPEVVFKFLPMDQRLQGLPADALDGFIARSPWGIKAEEQKLGSLVSGFSKKDPFQRLVTVCRKDVPVCERICGKLPLERLAAARKKLSDPVNIEAAASMMEASGKPHIPIDLLKRASLLYEPLGISNDEIASIARVTSELQRLYEVSMLPPQVAPTEQTARLISSAA